MKTQIVKFSALMIILALTVGSQLQAKDYSFSLDKKDPVKVIIHTPTIICIFSAVNINDSDSTILDEECQNELLEDWMFTELITSEEAQPLEDWMFEALLGGDEEDPVKSI